MSIYLEEQEVRRCVAMVAEATEAAICLGAKRALLEKLRASVGADFWSLQLVTCAAGGASPRLVTLASGGSKSDLASEDEARAAASLLAREVFGRQDEPWQAVRSGSSPILQGGVLWLERSQPPMILSATRCGGHEASLIGLYRRRGRSAFAPQELRLARVLLSEVTWLHQPKPQEAHPILLGLPRSRRLVLDHLLAGYARKQIASELGLSLHTVSDYIKEIYVAFGVHSQVELIRRLSSAGTD